MELVKTLIFLIGEILTIMNCLLISMTFFEQKIKFTKHILVWGFIFIIMCFIVTDTLWRLCFGIVFEFLMFFIILDASRIRKFLIFIISALSEAFGNMWIDILLPYDYNPFSESRNLYIKIIVMVVFFLIYLISSRIRYKRNKMNYIPYYSFLNLLVSISILLLPLFIIRFFGRSLNSVVINLIFIFVCFAVMSNICFFLKHNNKLIENSDYKLQLSYKDQLLFLQKKYTEDIVKSYQDLRKFRHDYSSKMKTIEYLIENKEYDKLQMFISDIKKEIFPTTIQCYDIYISATVNQMYERINEENLNFSFQYHPVKALNIGSVQICSLFYNLLSNAIDAAKQSDEKIIELTISSYNHSILIDISNSVRKDFNLENVENNITTKDEKELHGFGLINIKDIVNSYGGNIKFVHDKNLLEISIVMLNAI